MAFSDTDWNRILTSMGVKPIVATAWASAFADEVIPERFSKGMDDVVAWLPEILHECEMLTHLEERLSYNPERICAVWPARFPTLASAIPYSHNPQALANKVYGGRLGNVAPNDGWDFRGRCLIMITGQAAYLHVGDLIGQDLISLPDLILQPHFAIDAAIHWWEDRIPDTMLSDQVKLRQRVQGADEGLQDVLHLAQLAKKVFA